MPAMHITGSTAPNTFKIYFQCQIHVSKLYTNAYCAHVYQCVIYTVNGSLEQSVGTFSTIRKLGTDEDVSINVYAHFS